MVLTDIPVVLLVFITSFLAAPLIYTLDKLAEMQDQRWIFAAGVVTLPLFGMMVAIFVKRSPAKKEPLFYVWSIFSFTAVVDLFIGLELDGYVQGFMEFYLREGEPYLRSSYGTMINWYDGTAHFSMYITMIWLLCSGLDYRQVGLYWVGSIMNSMIVFMPGNFTGNKGIKWSYLLNVPYVWYPVYSGIRFISGGMKIKHKQPKEKQTWQKVVEWIFGVWFVFAMAVAGFRMISCMGCKDFISEYYVTKIEPYLMDPTEYGRTQALCYFYYYVPFYVGAVCSLVYPGQFWVKDWSLVHAGASMQAQFVFICSSLKWRTAAEHIVPNTMLARSIFWSVNLSLLIMPHLFALYCNREEFATGLNQLFSRLASTGTKQRGSMKNEHGSKVIKPPHFGSQRPLTRQHKKNL